MAYYTDLMEMKNDTARKNAIRERIATVIEKAMIEEFGAENVRRMKNTIAAAVGEVTNKAGQTMDACVEIAPKCCSWDYVVKRMEMKLRNTTLTRHMKHITKILRLSKENVNSVRQNVRLKRKKSKIKY